MRIRLDVNTPPWVAVAYEWSTPMVLPSLANGRHHWRTLLKIKQHHRVLARGLTAREMITAPFPGRVWVIFTRRGRRKLDDDNLASAFKHMRDGVADALRIDDGAARISWSYTQTLGIPDVTCRIYLEHPAKENA